jgi:hypothetical protein
MNFFFILLIWILIIFFLLPWHLAVAARIWIFIVRERKGSITAVQEHSRKEKVVVG